MSVLTLHILPICGPSSKGPASRSPEEDLFKQNLKSSRKIKSPVKMLRGSNGPVTLFALTHLSPEFYLMRTTQSLQVQKLDNLLFCLQYSLLGLLESWMNWRQLWVLHCKGGAHMQKYPELEISRALWIEIQCALKSNIFLVASCTESKNKNRWHRF